LIHLQWGKTKYGVKKNTTRKPNFLG